MEKKHVVIEVLIKSMRHAGRFSGMTGLEKKDLVLQMLEYELELPTELEKMVIALIDVLIAVENQELVINPKVKKTISLLCCTSR